MASSSDAIDLQRAQRLELGFGFVVLASVALGRIDPELPWAPSKPAG